MPETLTDLPQPKVRLLPTFYLPNEEGVVEAVVDSLAPRDGVETVRHTDEDEYFPPPRNLRDLLASIRVFAGLGFAGPPPAGSFDDRSVDASEALAALDYLSSAT